MLPMMKCGHTAQGRDQEGIATCIICWPDPKATQIADELPDLTGRTARCPNCGKTTPSSTKLAFFRYKGPGSEWAIHMCKCGYYEVGHSNANGRSCKSFEPHGPAVFDEYYCGCRGWD